MKLSCRYDNHPTILVHSRLSSMQNPTVRMALYMYSPIVLLCYSLSHWCCHLVTSHPLTSLQSPLWL